ncbi:MAG: peptidylprolyl isomerase [Planctomycetota bacterium]|jgi:hypothetical protein
MKHADTTLARKWASARWPMLTMTVLMPMVFSRCASQQDGGSRQVSSTVRDSRRADQPTGSSATTAVPNGEAEAIATVNGRPILRSRVINLLLRSGGPGVLEQLVVLSEAEHAAADRGLQISRKDVQAEYDSALRMLTDPLANVTTGRIDREAAERSLRAVLAERNISQEEFMLGMRRRAYLRKLVEADMAFTESDLREEMSRRYGERVAVRHIQLASPRNLRRIQGMLAGGTDFGTLASLHSANLVSAPSGGLLEPFSKDDSEISSKFREAAFGLSAGEVSPPVEVGEWYHLIKLERRIPAESVKFNAVRDELEKSLRERRREPAMQAMYEKLFRAAVIEIYDPVLKDTFDRVHKGP